MTLLSMSSEILSGFLGIWTLFIFWISVLLVYSSLKNRQIRKALAPLFTAAAAYILMQSITVLTSGDFEGLDRLRIARAVVYSPAVYTTLLCTLLSALLVYLLSSYYRWRKDNINNRSLKQSIDRLPAGICCWLPDGRILLKNPAVEELCRKLTGKALVNGAAFSEQVFDAPVEGCIRQDLGDPVVLVFPDGSAYEISSSFADSGLDDLNIMIAVDITGEYSRARTLEERKNELEVLNQKMIEYRRELTELMTAGEMLNARIRIHDDLGTGLLTAKQYLIKGGSPESRRSMLELLRRNMDLLIRDTQPQTSDEYSSILDTASKLGVKIDIIGTLPQTQPHKHITAAAMHECLTNTLRHAGGNILSVQLTDESDSLYIKLTNNGRQPESHPVEKGGLSSLRMLTESCSGSMQIMTQPEFSLNITLPKEA